MFALLPSLDLLQYNISKVGAFYEVRINYRFTAYFNWLQ